VRDYDMTWRVSDIKVRKNAREWRKNARYPQAGIDLFCASIVILLFSLYQPPVALPRQR